MLGTSWQPRALLRAQLAEQGLGVLATDAWPAARRWLRPDIRPRLVVVDLQGLPDADRILAELTALVKPERVLVLTALGTMPADQIRARGFNVMRRPVSIGAIVAEILRRVQLS